MNESLRGLVLLPPMMYMAVLRTCHTARALETWSDSTYVVSHLRHLLVVVSVTERVGGNNLFVALIDSESVAIATLWRLLTPTVGVNSLGQIRNLIGPDFWFLPPDLNGNVLLFQCSLQWSAPTLYVHTGSLTTFYQSKMAYRREHALWS